MTVFKNYARYYDLLYQDKNYTQEAQFIHQLIQQYAPHARQLLELGCGTGSHAVVLAKQGYHIHGVDFSSEMLQQAGDRLSRLTPELSSRLCFTAGDIRSVRINQTFDVVLSLFHVISYQIANEDLQSAFETVRAHLQPGGIFIFDVWYGPAVLTNYPEVRVKRLEDDKIKVVRVAEPTVFPNENIVDVNYQILIQDVKGRNLEEIHEVHRMRYLFKTEIELMLQQFKLRLLVCREWLTNKEPGFNTWGVYFLVQV
jgi:SAM-dependent methyltransferase